MNKKIGLLTLDVGRQNKVISNLSIPNFQKYCDLHGYELCVDTQTMDFTRPPAWSKHLSILKHLHLYDWLFWIDSDCIIMNQNKPIHTLIKNECDMIISPFMIVEGFEQAPYILHTGAFLIKNCEWSFDFLKRVYAEEQSILSFSVDETAVTDLYRANEKDREHIRLTHFKNLCSIGIFYEEGHFAWHFARKNNEERVKSMIYALKQIK